MAPRPDHRPPRRRAAGALAALLLTCGLATARADCPPETHEAQRPDAPCVAGDRIWTPRLDWPEAAREPPAAVKAEVARLAALLAERPDIGAVRIEAHEIYDAKRRAWGRCVSCDRARALARALVAAGVDPGRVEARGHGEDRPLFDDRDPKLRRLNQRFEWHITRWRTPRVDRAEIKAVADRWAGCFEGSAVAPALTLLLDRRGRLATVVLDRPGPVACLTRSIGRRLADVGPLRITWPAVDRPAPFPPGPVAAPAVEGRTCPAGTDERRRPEAACVDADGTRIWLPPLPRHPKSRQVPTRAFPTLDGLVALLRAAPQIARVRIEMHDYRDPDAGDRALCHPCARAQAVMGYLTDRGVHRDRLRAEGAHADRPATGRDAGEGAGPPRYEVHIEGWMPGSAD